MSSDFRVAVLGSGAMGSLYGGRLAASGVDVTLVDVWADHIQAIRNEGLQISSNNGTETVDIKATTDPGSVRPVDLVLVFVKSTKTTAAMADATDVDFGDHADVLTLQNGLGNPESIAKFISEERVIAGTTSHGATLKGPGKVFHAGVGPTHIGRYFTSNDDRVRTVADTLHEAGFETAITDSIRDAIWRKALVNIGINAPTALARVKNGVLASTEPGRRVVEMAVAEAARVARAEGHHSGDDIVEHVLQTAEATAENASSMRQDVEAGRETEIERLHGAVVERAERVGVDVPINLTLADLVRLTEHGAGFDRSDSER